MTQKIAQKIVEKGAKYATSLRATAAAFPPYLSLFPSLSLSVAISLYFADTETDTDTRSSGSIG